jgi:hypothetical protein
MALRIINVYFLHNPSVDFSSDTNLYHLTLNFFFCSPFSISLFLCSLKLQEKQNKQNKQRKKSKLKQQQKNPQKTMPR